MSAVIDAGVIYMPTGELVDFKAENSRFKMELEKMVLEIKRCETMLNNKGFMLKAPKDKIEIEMEKLLKYKKHSLINLLLTITSF